MAIEQADKRDGRDYANNIQKMYNRVQKFKATRALEDEAKGIKPFQPPVADSKFKDKFRVNAAVILERYPNLFLFIIIQYLNYIIFYYCYYYN